MHIQSYQIHNVLNVYRRQLSQGKSNHPQQVDIAMHSTRSDAITISKEGKNQSIMEKVAADTYLKKITNVDPDQTLARR
jgi:vacuolar-type H+-ATPase subunit C/Vma6